MPLPTPAFAAMIILACLLSACEQAATTQEKSDRPDKVVVVYAVKALPFGQRLQALGSTRAQDSVIITPSTSGVIEKILFDDGQYVHKGQALIVLDQDKTAALLQAARVQRDEHQRELRRLQTLISRQAASVRDLDARQTLLALSESKITEIKAQLNDLTIRAPFAGVLGNRDISVGAWVQAGSAMTTLDDLRHIYLDFHVPASNAPLLQIGADVLATTDARPNRSFQGKISSISARIDTITRSVLVRAIFDNSDSGLQPGLLMQTTILSPPHPSLLVPEESITQQKNQHFLSLVNAEGQVEIRNVRPGERNNGQVEIIEGLRAGELVIVRGMGFVKSGQAVRVSHTWADLPPAELLHPDSREQ